MVLSDGWVVGEELYQGRSQVEEGGPVALEGRQEHPRLEPGDISVILIGPAHTLLRSHWSRDPEC